MTAPLRRVGLLGDIHAEDERLALILTWFKGQAIGDVLSVGDLADGHGDLDYTCRLLAMHRVVGVRGNHDRWLIGDEMRDLRNAQRPDDLDEAALAWITALPPTRRLTTVAGDLLLCHGVGADDMVRLRPNHDGYALESNTALRALITDTSLAFAVGGHTHQRMVRSFDRRGAAPLVFINPGTLHRDYDSGFAVADFERGIVEFYDLHEETGGRLALRAAETQPLRDD